MFLQERAALAQSSWMSALGNVPRQSLELGSGDVRRLGGGLRLRGAKGPGQGHGRMADASGRWIFVSQHVWSSFGGGAVFFFGSV